MKKRIQHIIWLALLANLGLITFQLYWLNSNYRINQNQFKKEVQEGLEESVEEMMFDKTRALILSNDKRRMRIKTLPDSAKVAVAIPGFNDISIDTMSAEITVATFFQVNDSNYHSLMIPDSNKALSGTFEYVSKEHVFQQEAENLVQKVFKSLIIDNLNLVRLDSIYKKELSSKLIDTDFKLNLFLQDSLVDQYSNGKAFNPLYRFRSKTGLLPPNYSIEAVFPRQTLFILKKMGLSIMVSLLLIGIMLASFFYMLNIIFKQKRLAEIKNDFINNMTHELKTPISILSTANEALLNFRALEDPEKTHRYLGIFQRELDRLTIMVEKVLNISVYEKDSFSLKKEKINLAEMIDSLVEHYQIPREKPINIHFLNKLNHPELMVDKVHFYNVLNNLFDNAVKYAKDEIQIRISAFETENNLIVEIEDRGIGIPKAHQKSIFDKFYRVPTGNLHNVKGFGLGLSYVKRIIEKHGGSVGLKSELNKGSTFTISIPRA